MEMTSRGHDDLHPESLLRWDRDGARRFSCQSALARPSHGMRRCVCGPFSGPITLLSQSHFLLYPSLLTGMQTVYATGLIKVQPTHIRVRIYPLDRHTYGQFTCTELQRPHIFIYLYEHDINQGRDG